MSKDELRKALDEVKDLKARVDLLEERINSKLQLMGREIKGVRTPLIIITTLITTALVSAILSLVIQ